MRRPDVNKFRSSIPESETPSDRLRRLVKDELIGLQNDCRRTRDRLDQLVARRDNLKALIAAAEAHNASIIEFKRSSPP
jgi:hypothetical protein